MRVNAYHVPQFEDHCTILYIWWRQLGRRWSPAVRNDWVGYPASWSSVGLQFLLTAGVHLSFPVLLLLLSCCLMSEGLLLYEDLGQPDFKPRLHHGSPLGTESTRPSCSTSSRLRPKTPNTAVWTSVWCACCVRTKLAELTRLAFPEVLRLGVPQERTC